MSLVSISHVDFKKGPCRDVEFNDPPPWEIYCLLCFLNFFHPLSCMQYLQLDEHVIHLAILSVVANVPLCTLIVSPFLNIKIYLTP